MITGDPGRLGWGSAMGSGHSLFFEREVHACVCKQGGGGVGERENPK